MPIRPNLPSPEFGEQLDATQESEETLRLIARRRSTPAAMLTEPGPERADLMQLIRLAARAPDHRKLGPWRFLVFSGEARNALGDILAAERARRQEATEAEAEQARTLPMRAPAIIAIVSSPVDDPKQTPKWEQELSAGAVCQNLLLAANASGWAACWITEWPALDSRVAAALGLAPSEKIAGFIYLGTARTPPTERQRPDLAPRITFWGE